MERHVDQFSRIGVRHFAIITGYHKNALEETCADIRKKYPAEITTIYNEKYELENGYSLYAAKKWVLQQKQSEFLFTMADHYYDEGFLAALKPKLTLAQEEEALRLVVDPPGEHNKHIDLQDVTKVEAQRYIKKIGKKIQKYNYYDTGLFYAKQTIFQAFDQIDEGQNLSISNLVTYLAERRKATVIAVTGHYWNDIDTREDLQNTQAHAI